MPFQTGIVVLTTSAALRRGTTVAVTQLCSKFVNGLTYVHLINDNTVNELREGRYSPAIDTVTTTNASGRRLTSNRQTIPLTQWFRRYVTDFYTRTANCLGKLFCNTTVGIMRYLRFAMVPMGLPSLL